MFLHIVGYDRDPAMENKSGNNDNAIPSDDALGQAPPNTPEPAKSTSASKTTREAGTASVGGVVAIVGAIVGAVVAIYAAFVPQGVRDALFCGVIASACSNPTPSPTPGPSLASAALTPATPSSQQNSQFPTTTTATAQAFANTPTNIPTATSLPPTIAPTALSTPAIITSTDPSIYFERLPYLCEYRSTTNEFISLDPYDAGSVLLNKQSQAEIRTWPLAARHFDFENNQQIYGMDMGLRISTTNPSAQNGSIVATAPFTITTILKRSIEGELVEIVSRCRQDIASASPPHFDSQRILLSLNTAKLQNGLAQKLPEGLIASDELNSLKMHCRAPGVYQAIIQVGYSFAGKQGQVAHATEELVCPRIFRIWYVNELNVPQGMPSHRLEHQSIMYEWSENAQTYLPASDAVYSAKDPRPQFGPIYVCGDSERFNDKNDRGGCPFLTPTFGNKTKLIHVTWRLRNMTQGLEVRRQWLQDGERLCNEKTNIIGDPNQSGWELEREFAHTRLIADTGSNDAGECGLKASKDGYLKPGTYMLRIFLGKSTTPEREMSFNIVDQEAPAQ